MRDFLTLAVFLLCAIGALAQSPRPPQAPAICPCSGGGPCDCGTSCPCAQPVSTAARPEQAPRPPQAPGPDRGNRYDLRGKQIHCWCAVTGVCRCDEGACTCLACRRGEVRQPKKKPAPKKSTPPASRPQARLYFPPPAPAYAPLPSFGAPMGGPAFAAGFARGGGRGASC